MFHLTKDLAEVFAEDSDSEKTFYGFCEDELSDHCDQNSLLEDGYEGQDGDWPTSVTSKQQTINMSKTIRLSTALHSSLTANNSHNYDDDDENDGEAEERTQKSLVKEIRSVHMKEPEDMSDSFLVRRELNIKANKAMLAQLMADLQKMSGDASFLKKQEAKKPKDKISRPPRSIREPRKNPERVSRRQTRSMGGYEDPSDPQEAELGLSLEEELLEVRRAPRRRSTPQPNLNPHVIRPVDDITEDELQLVANHMTEKVYNRVTGSTCHQCRQKTSDTKTCCRSNSCRGIQGQFCGPCLRNRYGEDVKKALLDPGWQCPPCRGICNCSFCRQREGRSPTGILFPLAKYHGFSDVHSYLSSLRNKMKSDGDDTEM
ncbi:cell division cycle-associated protein 7-like isoform X1 [Hippocampus zosterae]|uniref:cell division cycle-associated protein 7-like isoform X1 n=1 Tax=Hippocampus zosterae TaxID=109293 RepID=UPI00223C9961|nr:cell division cycle-associated protein 7-like isoform X1 [Hippocampus zosterae]